MKSSKTGNKRKHWLFQGHHVNSSTVLSCEEAQHSAAFSAVVWTFKVLSDAKLVFLDRFASHCVRRAWHGLNLCHDSVLLSLWTKNCPACSLQLIFLAGGLIEQETTVIDLHRLADEVLKLFREKLYFWSATIASLARTFTLAFYLNTAVL